jgi:vacuolar-type H+-ATPase subunit I/STV1
LDAYLKTADWFSIMPEDIVPRLEVRTFVKDIKDDETRLQVMKFLLKYGDYYFNNISNFEPLENDKRSGGIRVGMQQAETASIDDFCRELTILIDQQEISQREKPDVSETITQLQKENDLLKDQLRKANEKITRQNRRIEGFKEAAIEMNVKYNTLQSLYKQLSKQLGIPVPTIVQGDLIHGEKHVGAHIDNVESGGIGSQIK